MRRNMILILLLIAIITGCSKKEEIVENEKQTLVTAVKAEMVKKATLYETIWTNGNVRVESSLEVYSAVSGRVVKSEVGLGKYVRKGDVIAVIDPSVNGGRYALHEVIAPISGTVLTNPVLAGSVISPETRIAVIGDLSELQISAFVPERFYGQLKKGLKAEISVEAYEDEIFGGRIKYVSPVIDEDSRTCEVILELDEKSSKIIAGMFADIKIYLKSYENVISVPVNCISSRSGESYVYTVEKDSVVKIVKIETAEQLENRAIVTSGLNENDRVVVEGFETLVDGGSVNVISVK